jgi:hypothetical protein
MCLIPFSQCRFRTLITLISFSFRLLFVRSFVRSFILASTPGRAWRVQIHRALADAYKLRLVGAREDNIEHVIHHLTKALEYVSIEGPASKTDRFGKGPLDGRAGTWSELLTELGSSYGERVKVS